MSDLIARGMASKNAASLAEIATQQNFAVYVESYPRLAGETDDTARIQRALNYANTLLQGANTVGGSLWYQTRASVIFNSQTYTTSSAITVPEGVDLVSEGQTIFSASPANNTVNCFTGLKVNRMRIEHLTFVGYATALQLQTSNVDVSMIKLIDCVFHKCTTGLDTVGINNSVSTLVNLERCISWMTDVFVINYCDKMVLENCWCTHSGHNGAAIVNHNNLVIQSGIYVPQIQSGASPRWIEFYTDSNNQQGLFCENVRFGAESGGIPIVYNHAQYDNNYSINYGKVISFKNCQLASGTGKASNIVLFAMPNRISIKDCYGLFNMTNGIISCDSSFDPTTIPITDLDKISIDLDNSAFQSPSYPRVDSRLTKYLKENKIIPPSNVYQPYYSLSAKNMQISSGSSNVIYNLGLVNGNTQAVLSLYITANNLGTNEMTKKRIDVQFKNNGASNQATAFNNPVATVLYQYFVTTAVDFTVTFAVVNNMLQVTLAPNTGTETMAFYITGEVVVPYTGVTGRSVFEN